MQDQTLLNVLGDEISDAFTTKTRVDADSVKFNADQVTYEQLEVVDSLATNTLYPEYTHVIVVKRSGTGVCVIVKADKLA